MSGDDLLRMTDPVTNDAASHQTLRHRFENAAKEFSTALSELLGCDCLVTVTELQPMVYGEFVLTAENPCGYYTLTAAPAEGRLLLQCPPRLLGLVLDRMLGATRQSGSVVRLPLSEIESRLMDKVVARFVSALQRAWQDLGVTDVAVAQTTINAGDPRLLPVDKEATISRFQIELSGAMTAMNLLMPSDWQRRLVVRRSTDADNDVAGVDEATTKESDATLDFVARLAETAMSAEDLAGLRVGDIITTEKDVGEPLDVTVGGKTTFLANLGKADGKKAVQIVEEIDTEDEAPDDGA